MSFSLRAHRPRRSYLWGALVVAVLAAGHAASELARGDVAVLCLHGIDDPVERYQPWSLSAEKFRRLLEVVAASGREVVGPEALDRLGDGTSGVLLTFDDGRSSDAGVVQPALASRGWPAVFFVPLASPPRQLTTEELVGLAAAGQTVGSHSRTHGAFLPRQGETAEAFAIRMQREAREGRRVLEEMLPGDAPVDLFAYPRGEHPPAAVEAVAEAGYRRAFTTEYGYALPGGDRLRTPRFMLFAETSLEEVEEFLRQPRADQRRQLWVALAVALAAALGLALGLGGTRAPEAPEGPGDDASGAVPSEHPQAP